VSGRQKLSLPPPRPAAERSKARELYLADKSYQEISEETNIPVSTLRNWCARDGWKLAKSQPDEFEIVPSREEIDTAIPDTLQECAEEYESNMAAASVIVSRRIAQMPPDEVVQKADRIKQIDSTARKALRIENDRPLTVIQIGVLAQSPAKREQALHSVVRPRRETLTLNGPEETSEA
jgi:hypothetical protein